MSRTVTALIFLGLLSACSGEPESPDASSSTVVTPDNEAGLESGLPGNDLAIQPSLRDLMNNSLERHAQHLWKAVRYVVTEDGVEEEVFPQTDEDWAGLMESANTLIATANDLLLPGRVIDPNPISPYPDWQYHPDEIQALRSADPDGWAYYVDQLAFTTRDTLATIERRDVLAFMEKSGMINNACQGCHADFWYRRQDR